MDKQVAARIAKRFITLTLDKRTLYLQKMLEEGVSPAHLPIPEVKSSFEALPLSFAQQRQWFLWKLDPQSSAYHIPTALRLRGALDVASLERSFNALIARHESLRTRFVEDQGRTLQVIEPELKLSLSVRQWSGATACDEAIAAFVGEQSQEVFDLTQAPLLRVTLLRLAVDDHVLVLTQHHIVSDGWSMQVMVQELVELYGAFSQGRQVELPVLSIQYADYAIWQRHWMEAGEQARQLEYWKVTLGAAQTVLELPTDHPRPAVQSLRGATLALTLEARLVNGIRQLAQQENVTLFMVLLASFQVLMHRYSGQREILIGVPSANRNRVETERLIGFFVNTQVFKAEVDGTAPFRQLLAACKQSALGAQAHQDLPFEQLVEALQLERSLSHNPLFQVMYNHQSAARQVPRAAAGPASLLDVEVLAWENHTAQLDLTLDTFESADGLSASLTYATDLFSAATVERMARHWQNLLRAVTADPAGRIGELPMLDDSERLQRLEQWNATRTAYPLERTVHSLIEQQASATPDAVALVFAGESLSYRQLDGRANHLAHQLIAQGVGPDVLVGIAVERSLEMVVGLLAILKAGGAYVPLDPEYPEDRLAYMIADSSISLLLTQRRLLARLPLPDTVATLCLDELEADCVCATPPPVALHPENLAYVIYTSGSTGKPKGAANRHSALTNRLCWMQQAYGLGSDDAVLQKTPFSFDVSVWEFFWPLLTGARLVIAEPGDHRDPARLVGLINQQRVTTLHFVPSMLQVFLQDENVALCTGLKRIVCSGEALQVDTQQQVFAKLPDTALYNLYGPTEAAIDVTHWTCREEGRDSVPIGEPIANLQTYVLSHELALVPNGVMGELYLGGEGLARGYHRRAGLTAERFVVSPLGDGQRLYRTGDLVRQRANGIIEYVGRIDHQVKVRGLRIELGEIEARLLEQASVREAVVLAIEGSGGLQLVGYVVPADDSLAGADPQAQGALRDALKLALKGSLPDYMVPAHWLFLAQLPLSPNGKLERKALPKPDVSQLQQTYVAPRNELQRRIATVWQEVLKVERVGLSDNFFELGGDSIISIQVVSRARQAGIRFTPKDLFQHQTVQGLATVAQVGDGGLVIEQGPTVGATPLLPFQRLFFATVTVERHHWNQSVLLKPSRPLDPAQLEQVLRALIVQHDVLRLRFSQEVDRTVSAWTATYRTLREQEAIWQQSPVLHQADAADVAALEQLGEEAQRSLDLGNGPLLRAVLVTMADGSQRLLLVIHHLVVDGVSWRILFEDLQTAYQQLQAGEALALPAKSSAFKRWAERLQAYARDKAQQQVLPYWLEQFQGVVADLPCDRPGAALQNRYADSVQSRLDTTFTQQLLQQAPAAYRTQINDLLLTALARVIGRWTRQASVLVQLEGHGREDLFNDIDLTRTLGWFTSLYPLKLTAQGTPGSAIKAIKEQVRAIPDKGLSFGALRYLGDEAAREALAGLPLPRITFNYLGQFDGSFSEAQGALFVPSGESRGAEQSPEAPLGNWLTVNSQVYAGELSVSWSFSREMFDVQTLQVLADEYVQELKELIAHCCESPAQGVTPSDFPLARLEQAQLDNLDVPAGQIENIYPLSPMQHGLLFHSLYEPHSSHYINQMRLDVEGLDASRFQQAWQAAMDAHDILRSRFVWQGEFAEPMQLVHKHLAVPFTVRDWRAHAQLDLDLEALAQSEQQDFDLSRAPLLRLQLVRTGENRHHLIYTHHHILMDGWSHSQLMGEVLQRYHGQTPIAHPGHYRDYIAWLQRQDVAVSESFWKAQLAPLQEPTRLAGAFVPAGAGGQGDLRQLVDVDTTRQLSEFARQQKITVNTLLQASWLLLLQRYTGLGTVCFGATVSGRPADLKGVEQQIGLFINTLPVIASPCAQQSVGEWLQAVQAGNVALREHEHTPLFDVQRWAGLGNDALFDSLLVFENYPVAEALQQEAADDLLFGRIDNHEQTNYPLTLSVTLSETLSLHYNYAQTHFSDAAVEQISRHLLILLVALSRSAQTPIGELGLLSADERRLQLEAWNANELAYPRELCIHQQIDAQASSQPQAIALTVGAQHWSYEQLNRRANQLAHRLIESGVGPEVRVGVAMSRSAQMVVALLAVLKAGGTYVPLDPDYPAERVAYMLEDSGAKVLLTERELLAGLTVPQAEILVLEATGTAFAEYPAQTPDSAVTAQNLAYVIYTSGSTGQPKGVAITHRNVAALIQWSRQVYSQDDLQGVLASTSICFDLSVWELFVTLARGGSIILARNALELPDLPARDQVRLINTVPSAIAALQRAGQIPASVRIINLAGEPLKQALVDSLYGLASVEHVYDLYGPSEDTTYSTWTRREAGGLANIGRPLANTQSYLLDSQLQPVPPGVAAELYLAGAGITRGYLFRPGLTAEKFVPNPFGESGERLYRTGDLCRYRRDGVLEYVGRLDHQVKVRGFRIELGEIEARLLAQGQLQEVAVLAVESGAGSQLVAYAVPLAGRVDGESAQVLRETLKGALRASLPDYMVPAHWLFLEALPLTPNGKLDRKALPAPDVTQAQKAYVQPQGELEQRLAAVWEDVLQVGRIGLSDNFFELGGDSILSIQVVSRARRAGIFFTPKDLFQHQTVRDLARIATLDGGALAIDQGPVEGVMPLLPIHQMFFEEDIPQRHHWNQSVMLTSALALDPLRLEQALRALILHHDTLRLGFVQQVDGWVATYRSVAEQQSFWQRSAVMTQATAQDGEQLQQLANALQASLDLQKGPLLRALLVNMADGGQRLLLVIHHLAVDGVSWRILFEDLQTAYQQLVAEQAVALPLKSSSLKSWAQHLQARARSTAQEPELIYWHTQLQGVSSDLPARNPQGRLQRRHATTVHSALDASLTRQLLQQAPAAYRTQINDLLLTALARVIGRWTGQTDSLIQLEGHGREDLFGTLDLTRSVGWFTSIFPVRLSSDADLARSIKQVKEQLRAIPDKGIGFGALRYLGDERAQSLLKALPVPRITFNYLGQFDGSFDGAQGALFSPCGDHRGAEQSAEAPLANWLTLNGQVFAGEFGMSWTFSREMFDEATIQHLARAYENELALLIEHCCAPDHQGCTPSDFPLSPLTQQQLDELVVDCQGVVDIYPLSPMQEGMLFHAVADSESSFYVNQLSLPVQGLDPQRFCEAWQAAVARHDILRTSFHWQGGASKPYQIVHASVPFDLSELDWRGIAVDDSKLQEQATVERDKGFDLACAPLQRLLLIRLDDHCYQVIWTSHHILMDGWSSSRLFGEVLQHYAKGEVAQPPARYRDFIHWLQRQDQSALQAFWQARLQPVDTPTSLAQAVHPRHVADLAGHQALYSNWDPRQTSRLQAYCRELRITLNTLIQGAWLLVLQRYTGQRTVSFGATVAGRPESLPGAEHMLGLFINTLPVIQTLEPATPLADWLRQLQGYNVDIRDYAHVPLADIQRWSGLGGQALFDSIIVFENYPIDERLHEDATQELAFGKTQSHDVTNFPMDLAVHLTDRLSIEYLFLRNCFAPSAVERIRQTLEDTVEAMLRQPGVALGQLQRLPTAQRQELLAWSHQCAPDTRPQLLPALIARHALERPLAIAVQCGGQTLTHAQLDRRSNQLAHALIARGAGPEGVIGVGLERSVDTIVALLAVLKSGAAYVPLDIDYPADRLAYMIEDSGMLLLISRSELLERFANVDRLPCLELDGFDGELWSEQTPLSGATAQSLAYLVYTSGSTGRPKGVAVPQGPLSMHCQAIARLYEMDSSTRELHFMSFAFDGAHERWLSTLFSGGRLVLRDGNLWTPEETFAALIRHEVTIACFPPAYLKQLADYAQASGLQPPAVRIYCFGGDAVPEQTFEQVKRNLRPQYITNGYGPTETVVTPMLWKAASTDDCEAAYAPIGRVVGERSLYVLDDVLEPLPMGFAGELYIGGQGVARGYHQRPALTAERFVPNPFDPSGERLYRTGDLVRLRTDGVLDYVGRIDQQVKVRGFRIELGEIEACLRQQAGVNDALVVARDSASGKQLIGYVVCASASAVSPSLKQALREVLPEYMVPAQIIGLSEFPVTPNGKIDRKALPEPRFDSDGYLAPRSDAQRWLAQIWAEVLHVERVGIQDNFFELGGDSILSLQVVSRVRNHPDLQMDLKLRDLMRCQTIERLFDGRDEPVAVARDDRSHLISEGLFNLIPIQEWFFAQDMAEPHHFNQALLLRPRQSLDSAALEAALNRLILQHDALRLRFRRENGRWYQYYAPAQQCIPAQGLLWRCEAADGEALKELANRVQRSLHLEDGPLFRAVQIDMADGQSRLLLVIHHLVIDTVSWRILLQDMQSSYESLLQGLEPELAMRTSSYQAWSERLRSYGQSLVDSEQAYWLEQLDRPGHDLPCDNPRGKNQVRHVATAHLELSAQATTDLLKKVPLVYQTQINDVLLAALSRVLCRWSEQSSVLVQFEGHGREDLFDEIELSRTVGWFTSMFPVRLAPGVEAGFADSIRAVQAQLAALPNKGMGYGALRYLSDASVVERLSRLPQARVTFNYLGQFDQSFDDNALFVPADESSGDSYSLQAELGNWLEIVGQVFDGKLALRCLYSRRRYRPETVETLMANFQAELEALIAHCLEQAPALSLA